MAGRIASCLRRRSALDVMLWIASVADAAARRGVQSSRRISSLPHRLLSPATTSELAEPRNMVAYALAQRIAPRRPLSSRGSRSLILSWRLGRWPSGCAVESRLERDACSSSAFTPFPDTYGNRSTAESRDSRCFAENSNRNPLRALHKKSAKNGRRAPLERSSHSKPPSDRLATARCVLFVQHSPEKDRQ
jgi:hypothetical protein